MKPNHESLLYLRGRLSEHRKAIDKWEVVREFVEDQSSIAFGQPYYEEGNKSYYIMGCSPLRCRNIEVRLIWFADKREYQSSLTWCTDVELMEPEDKFSHSVMVRWKADSTGMIDLACALLETEEIG